MKKLLSEVKHTFFSPVLNSRLLLTVSVVVLLLLVMAPAALAAGGSGQSFIFDETGSLTVEQISALDNKAESFLQKRGCAAYVWIVDLVPEEYARTPDTLEWYVDIFFRGNGLGYGDDGNGIVLLLEIGDVPGERDCFLYSHGSVSSVFDGVTRDRMLDNHIVPAFISAFGNGDFNNVANVFLDLAEEEYATDVAVRLALKLAVVILVPVIIALCVCSIWKAQMKTAKLAREADNYIPGNGFVLTGQTDQFLYRTTTRVKIERSDSGPGSSSSGRSSSGRSSGRKV